MNRVAVVADDHELVRDALEAILTTRFGFARVREAGSLDEALLRLDERPHADLVLLDLDMPGVASASSVAAVRQGHPATKVAVVSASQRRQDILMALAAGAHGYISKAQGAAAVGDALEAILRGEIYVPPSLAEPAPAAPLPAEAKAARPEAPPVLTPRQAEVLTLLVEGRSNKDIARRLGLGEGTVKGHVAGLLHALGVSNRSAAAAIGARLALGPRG